MSKTAYVALYPTDFLADVGHLGNTELGIYTRLLLVYYRDQRPLPSDIDKLRRIAMTFSPEEGKALLEVLSEFFIATAEPDGTRVWRHKRADREIDAAKSAREKRVKQTEAARTRRWSVTESVTDSVTGSSQTENQNQNQNQISPLSRGDRAPAARETPAALSIVLRKAGIDSQPGDPRLIALAEQGVSADTVRAAAEEAKRQKPGERIPVGFVVAILQRWAQQAAGLRVTGVRPQGAPDTDAIAAALQAKFEAEERDASR